MNKNEFMKRFEEVFKTEYSHGIKNKKIAKERFEKTIKLHFLRQDKLSLLKKFSSLKGKKVLDLGSGYGDFLVYAAGKGANITGIEPNKDRVELSSARLKFANFKGKVIQGVGEKLPFPDSSFDLVWCDNVIEHCESPESLIREIIRVKKESGVGFVFAPNYAYPFEVHYKRFYPFPYIPIKAGIALYFKLIGEPTEYLVNSCTIVTQKGIRNIIKKTGVEYYDSIFEKISFPDNIADKSKVAFVKFLNFFGLSFLIYWIYPHIQYVLLGKK